ncbi:unnamed protein product [Sympodiomycopsis kandeliae]
MHLSSPQSKILSALPLLVLLLVGMLCTVNAAPAGSPGSINDPALEKKTLTASNFQSELSDSLSLVEFYSPYCIHCKRFAPTFANLASIQEHLEEYKFKIRRVNCVASGDLCKDQGITGYPTLNLYLNGNKVEEYQGDRSFENLMAYTTAKSSDYRKTQSQPAPQPQVQPLPQPQQQQQRDL